MDAASPASSNAATAPHRIGQACDRCRKKKIKCDGASPTCRNCEKSGLSCEVSATLLRNRKVRGFASDQQHLAHLQAELVRSQEQLRAERDRNAVLQQQIARQEQLRPPPDQEPVSTGSTGAQAALQNERQHANDPAYIIKHMGRLVHDERGFGRFAGSTTGVHFVLSVEQECQKSLAMPGAFPASCFRLFLAQPSAMHSWRHSNSANYLDELGKCLIYPVGYYCQQAETFIKNWDAFCPVLVQNQLVADNHVLIDRLFNSHDSQEIDCAVILTLLMILSINKYSEDAPEPDLSCQKELSLANQLLDRVIMQRDIKSLQALILFALYNQLNGHCLSMTSLNGSMVSLAQSLGLHRHARRFKLSVGEIELRKRLWWWVYVFDRLTCILHGLPTLINDADVDNDMPVDCYLHDLDATDLAHPLPGERTAVFVFIQYVALGRKLSRILDLLYTTTRRRDGAMKIAELDLELRMWSQSLKAGGIFFDIGNVSELSSGVTHHGDEKIKAWLQLMANLAMVLVHRPGLSFSDTTTEFANCLRTCLDCSQVILSLLSDSTIPQWLRNLSLMGPGTVFQSALMYAYCQCKCLPSKPEGIPSLETSVTMISKGISILDHDLHYHLTGPYFYSESITEVIGTLRTLQSSLAQVAHAAADATNMMHEYHDPNIFDEHTWGSNALDELNYMTATDWMGEIPGPFMGFMDLSGS